METMTRPYTTVYGPFSLYPALLALVRTLARGYYTFLRRCARELLVQFCDLPASARRDAVYIGDVFYPLILRK